MTGSLEKLANIFYDPKTGFVGLNKLIEKAEQNGIYLPESKIKKWYYNQDVNQIYKEKKDSRDNYYKVVAPAVGYLEADLIDISNLARYNHGYKWILNMIDLRSRYVWAAPVKSKTAEEIAPFVEKVIKSVSRRYPKNIITLTTDDGGEFKGPLKVFLDRNDIDHYIANPNNNTKRRTAHVESWNRNLLRMLFKVLHVRNNWDWVTILPDLIYNHNHSINKQISITDFSKKNVMHDITPYDVFIKHMKSHEVKVPFHDDLKIGDYVRIRSFDPDSSESNFRKKTREQKYTKTVYRIIGREGVRYLLTLPGSLEALEQKYLPRQLLKVSTRSMMAPKIKPVPIGTERPTYYKLRTEKRVAQREAAEDIKKENIITTRRIRRPNVRLVDY